MERLQAQRPINSFLVEASTATGSSYTSLETPSCYGLQVPFLQLLQGTEATAPLLLRFHNSDQLESCINNSSEATVMDAKAAPRTVVVKTERKRKRAKPRPVASKKQKPEEAESQRMTHIAVERNRRRLMNEHLASLRGLIPPSQIPRGDQATLVAGAIEYVKHLEQQLFLLQAEAARRHGVAAAATEGVFVSPQYMSYSGEERANGGVDVEAMSVVGGHVRVRVVGRRTQGQLVRAVAAMEELRLLVLHLSVAALDDESVVYSINLKMDEGCEVATADEVATVLHQIFAYTSCCCC